MCDGKELSESVVDHPYLHVDAVVREGNALKVTVSQFLSRLDRPKRYPSEFPIPIRVRSASSETPKRVCVHLSHLMIAISYLIFNRSSSADTLRRLRFPPTTPTPIGILSTRDTPDSIGITLKS